MILLELTEKEVDFVKEVIGLEKQSVENSTVGWDEKQRKIGICNSFLAKVEESVKPKGDVLITAKDLFFLISQAKSEYSHLPLDMHLSVKFVEKKDLAHISVANAMIMWLNGRNLLKRLPRFDVTDSSCKFEEMDE